MRPVPILVAALLAVSAAGTLVRLAPELHPVSAGFGRLAVAALILAPGLRAVARRDAAWMAFAGLCLAGHFWAWFASLHIDSVMRSTVLVCTTPIWAGVLEARVLGAAPPRNFWAGIAVAIVGLVAMLGFGEGRIEGDLLALLGSWLGATYLTVGRVVRQRVGIATYGAGVFGAAALWLLPAAWIAGAALVPTTETEWAVIVALALGPQLVGHLGFNYAVRTLPAATISTVILLEPVGATLIAAFALGEVPGVREIVAGVVVLAGVGMAVRR